jgi:hypothetical protein
MLKRHTSITWLASFTFLASVLAFGQGGEIKGSIVSAILGDTIPEAIVRLKGPVVHETLTLKGIYGFRELPPGEYAISATVRGYFSETYTFTILDSSRHSHDFRLSSSDIRTRSAELAERDIRADSMRLFFGSGIVGYTYTDNDLRFQRVFRVTLCNTGCIDKPETADYNRVIMEYLEQRYGRRWRDQVDVPYLPRYSSKR